YRGSDDNRHFYRVPKKPAVLRERWLEAIGRTEDTIVSQLRVCSGHFHDGEKRASCTLVPVVIGSGLCSGALPFSNQEQMQPTRPLVALLDGRDCSIEMPVLRDLATVAFCDALSVAEVHEKVLNEATVAIMWSTIRLGRSELAQFKRLRLLHVKHPTLAFHPAGIWVSSISGACVEETADSTISLVLNLYRRTARIAASAVAELGSESGWPISIDRLAELAQGATRIRGQTLGIVGFGRVGTAVALRAKAFGFEVVAFDPNLPDGADRGLGVSRADSLEGLLAAADCLSLHCPPTAANRGLLSRRLIRECAKKTGFYLINTCSVSLMDELAVAEALKDGTIRGLGLDTPDGSGGMLAELGLNGYSATSDLEGSPAPQPQQPQLNIMVTPGSAFFSDQSHLELRRLAAEEIKRGLTGPLPAALQFCVNCNGVEGGDRPVESCQSMSPASSDGSSPELLSSNSLPPQLKTVVKTPAPNATGQNQPLLTTASLLTPASGSTVPFVVPRNASSKLAQANGVSIGNETPCVANVTGSVKFGRQILNRSDKVNGVESSRPCQSWRCSRSPISLITRARCFKASASLRQYRKYDSKLLLGPNDTSSSVGKSRVRISTSHGNGGGFGRSKSYRRPTAKWTTGAAKPKLLSTWGVLVNSGVPRQVRPEPVQQSGEVADSRHQRVERRHVWVFGQNETDRQLAVPHLALNRVRGRLRGVGGAPCTSLRRNDSSKSRRHFFTRREVSRALALCCQHSVIISTTADERVVGSVLTEWQPIGHGIGVWETAAQQSLPHYQRKCVHVSLGQRLEAAGVQARVQDLRSEVALGALDQRRRRVDHAVDAAGVSHSQAQIGNAADATSLHQYIPALDIPVRQCGLAGAAADLSVQKCQTLGSGEQQSNRVAELVNDLPPPPPPPRHFRLRRRTIKYKAAVKSTMTNATLTDTRAIITQHFSNQRADSFVDLMQRSFAHERGRGNHFFSVVNEALGDPADYVLATERPDGLGSSGPGSNLAASTGAMQHRPTGFPALLNSPMTLAASACTVQSLPLTAKSQRFLAAPKPPGKMMASKSEARSCDRGAALPRAIRADSISTLLGRMINNVHLVNVWCKH
uniref:THAP-type domain-containing protein n=1 Tax=Macrostomum lignano TaxID=282301 RepID=A0A1I8G8E5_9PLAT